MHITYLGQSGFMITVDGKKLLIDPFLTGNPKATAKPGDLHPDYILISHGHGDHIGDAVEIAAANNAPIIAVYEIAEWLAGKCAPDTRGMNLGGTIDLDGIKVQMVPAWHSSTLPDGTPGGVAAGFIVTHAQGCFYHSGDTALFEEMKLFGRRHKIDTAFLCLGGHFTMDAVDAVHAAGFVGAKNVIGMHFDTFPPIEIDHAATHALFDKAGIKLILPEVGKAFEV